MSSLDMKPCVFCHKTCKSSDSRPYPTLKSAERIHNRCQLKKNLADKKQQSAPVELKDSDATIVSKPVDKLQERFNQEKEGLKTAFSEKKNQKLVQDDDKRANSNDVIDNKSASSESGGQFFFDIKAGIAKPHEKRRYLYHKKITDTVTRYTDDGFKEEALGRAYDHTGKDLDQLGDESSGDDDEVKRKSTAAMVGAPIQTDKRKTTPRTENPQPRKKNTMVPSKKNACWFCLSSDNIEQHLIIAIGQHCYLALAKGGLVDDHLLIMPIEHIACTTDKKLNSQELLLELEDFKNSLIDYFDKQSKGVVFFERNFKSMHWQLQAVPIPMDSIVSVETDIKSISKKYYKNSNYIDLPDNCTIGEKLKNEEPYFFWQIEPLGTRFLAAIDAKDSTFPIQLGRMVLSDSSILNCPDKVDWKVCVKTIDEYGDIANRMKQMYLEFDFTK